MAWLKAMFSGGKKKGGDEPPPPPAPTAPPKASDTEEQVRNMKDQIELFELREKKLEFDHKEAMAKVSELVSSGNKQKAVYALKRAKTIEGEQKKILDLRSNAETILLELEAQAFQQSTTDAFVGAGKHLKKQNNDARLKEVEDNYDDLQDALDAHTEINDVLARPLGGAVDDEDLMAELNSFEAQQTEAKMAAISTGPDLSGVKVPSGPIQEKPVEDESDDIKALEAELNGM
eukprot:NODE_3996_length_852_cov_39.814446_g3314_i0.p1 GENE.NODE_3996_length_852_cov_39.814446_g3314_i0~~NODE_3996_length_852_cov_39.814446_g3314_i0.p1  ORF type:complete len:233 (+),score=73.88 NODE_3996_length_852_cov_39.814446_g3314_i0:49-747(+)